MGAVLDITQLVAPGLTALGGAYYGARWQARSAVDVELRAAVDEGVKELQRLARATGTARSNFIADGAHTSEEGKQAMTVLDERLFDAQDVRDRLMVRTRAADPVSVHYLNALLAVGRALEALKGPYFWPNKYADRYAPKDLEVVIRKLQDSEREYGEQRALFLEAAQTLIAPRAGVLRQVLNRAKRSKRSRTQSTAPSTDALDPGDG